MRTTSRTLALLLASTLLGAAPALAQSQGTEADRLSHVDGNLPDAGNAPGKPAETAEANAPSQKPAFEGQTRAPQPTELAKVETTVLADGLPHLWAMEFLPDGRMLVTAKKGAMMVLSADGKTRTEVSGVPKVESSGQGGLLDVALSPGFAEDGMIYFTFSEPREGGGNGTSLGSAKLVMDGDAAKLEGMKVVYQQIPAYDGNKHFGSRIVFAPDGKILLGVGERSDTPIRDQAQDLNSGLGKVFRINADGSIPEDNPFLARENAQDAIWSYGHRNIQSAALDGEGRLWVVEHGARGGDELNRPEAGKNYGWPVITYGVDYGGNPIGEGKTAGEGMEQPAYYWDPVIGPSGMAFYQGDEFPAWKGAFLIGGLVTQGLVVVHVDGDRVKSEERVPLEARIRDVKVGPDGAVYALTERREGEGSSTIVRVAAAD
ncbi:PQQ-dependent sugar dehydrogenase [Aureimonas sp. AU40]|uniref:PQQ-dependent sugar dehydrogenase n=1 Tax=Aureimonas sp. AU40 TaxID=1637747 RepID=UPI0007832D91|nr:PQQ-dependent sugar dehydrogenase [Aureimonas sp. AU40]